MRGIADFLVRVDDPTPGACAYEPVDAKLARTEAKPGHVLQLCFYADALAAATGAVPGAPAPLARVGADRVAGRRGVPPLLEPAPQPAAPTCWTTTRPRRTTRPEPCTHCDFCEFAGVCDAQWRDEDSLVYVAGIRATDVLASRSRASRPWPDSLACVRAAVDGRRPPRAARAAGHPGGAPGRGEDRSGRPAAVPPHRGRRRPVVGPWPRAAARARRRRRRSSTSRAIPSGRPTRGLFFLFGLIARGADGDWAYEARWAHDRAGEERATGELIEFLQSAGPPTRACTSTTTTTPSDRPSSASPPTTASVRSTLTDMVDTGLFVDLYPVVRNADPGRAPSPTA